MKKKFQLGVLILAMGLCLTGCCMSHEWNEAACTTAKACAKCGETEGEALGHAWVDATCTEAKTCSTCGEVEGEALGHDWKEATLNDPKTCSSCGLTEGTPNKEAVTAAAEAFLKAMDEVDRETIADSCMGFVLIDMGMAQLSIDALESAFYTAVGIDKEMLSEEARLAVTEYGETCAESAVQGYSVEAITENNGVITVTATIRTFSPDAQNPMESEELMLELEDMAEVYVEKNMIRLLDIYLEEGEEAVTMQMYNDLIPEILEMCNEAISIIPLDDVEIMFIMEKLGDKWIVTEVLQMEGEGDFLL